MSEKGRWLRTFLGGKCVNFELKTFKANAKFITVVFIILVQYFRAGPIDFP
jgi:hypothetical protein